METLLSTIGMTYQVSDLPGDEAAGESSAVLRLTTTGSAVPVATPEGTLSLRDAGIDLMRIFSALAREDEYLTRAQDEYGRFLWRHENAAPARAPHPWVSEQAQDLLGVIERGCERAGVPLIRKARWPGGKKMAACLTHDVDAVRRGKLPRGIAVRDVAGVARSFARGRWDEAAKKAATIAGTAASGIDPYWTFDRISSLERQHGYRSTYFFMSSRLHPKDATYDLSSPAMARLLRQLAGSGCEIALHGSYAHPSDTESMRDQKRRLERALGAQVTGYRNHILRFRAPESWRAHAEAGFSYDSTLGFADHEGYRGGHAFPFHPYDLSADSVLELLELPLSVMDVTMLKYRRLHDESAWEAVSDVLERTRAVEGLGTLLWHNDTFYAPEHPISGWLYERVLAWLSDRDVHVATCAEVDRWWRARDAVRMEPLPQPAVGWRMDVPLEIDGLELRIRLPDPQRRPRLREAVPATISEDAGEYTIQLTGLRAGSRLHIDCL